MKLKFRILLIDDTKEVLELVKANLPPSITASQFTIELEVETLHVELTKVQKDGKEFYEVSENTIQKLGIYTSSIEKFDYIFSDFGYIGDKKWNQDLKEKLLKERRGVRADDIEGQILQLKDIAAAFHKSAAQNKIAPLTISSITEKFINHTGNIILYTNSPEPFNNYFESPQLNIRKQEVRDVFKRAKDIEFILMHVQFVVTSKIDQIFSDDNERKTYFSTLLSEYIQNKMKYIALEHMVESQNRLRFKNSHAGAKRLIRLGLILGAISAVLGEMLFHFFDKLVEIGFEHFGFEWQKTILGIFAITVILGFICYQLLVQVSVKVAEKTEKIANELSSHQEGSN